MGCCSSGTARRRRGRPASRAQSGDEYDKLMAENARHMSKQDWRKAAKVYRMAIALKPDDPVSYFNLGNVLNQSGHQVEATQRFLEAKERWSVGSDGWAKATAHAFNVLLHVAEVAKPEWWNEEGLKALSARVVRAAPNEVAANDMRAIVLSGQFRDSWEAGPRSAVELKEAAVYFERAAALCAAPAQKAMLAGNANWCRNHSEAMSLQVLAEG